MAFTQKLFTSYHGYSDGDTRIGEKNRIWYDSNTNTFRIQLDDTPGGTIIGGSSGGGTATYPTQTGHAGQFLQTNGSVVLWATVPPGATGPKGDTGALRVIQEVRDQKVIQVLQDLRATREIRVLQDLRATRAHKDHKAIQALQAHKVLV